MREYTYYLFNLVVLLPVLLLSFKTDVKPHRHLRAFLASLLLVSLPFLIWDSWAASAGHWLFRGDYITGPHIFNLPLEEILFFVTVPFAMVYVWGVIKKFVADKNIAGFFPLLILAIMASLSIVLLIEYPHKAYTLASSVATLIAVIVLAVSRITYTKRFWVFQLALLGLFLVFNTILTMLPVITYGDEAIVGLKVFSIPLEDFLYAFSFINLFLIVFHNADKANRLEAETS